MTAIWKREMQSYFFTPVGYVFIGVFLGLSGIMFYMLLLVQRSGDVLTFLGQLSYLWMLLCPVLTMRLLADERARKTDQLLLTCPVSLTGVVLGKYLAAVTVMAASALLTLVYVLIVGMYGTVYPGELMVGYLGFILQGSAFIALDLFLSGCTSNQVTAAVTAFGVNFALWVIDLLQDVITQPLLSSAIGFVSLYDRYEPFLMGQLSFASIGYDLSFIAVFLILTVHSLDARRYRGA